MYMEQDLLLVSRKLMDKVCAFGHEISVIQKM